MRGKVLVVGVFPTVYLSRCKSFCNPAHLSGVWNAYDQLKEYPEDFLEELGRVEAVVRTLLAKGFGVRLIHAFSPFGFWLSLRYKLGRGFHVIASNRAVKIDQNVKETVDEIESATSTHDVRRLRFRML